MVQKSTPLGGHFGTVLDRSGGVVVLEAGMASREWNRAKLLPLGPKGAKASIWLSEAKTEVPSAVWVVTTNRGAGSWVVAVIFVDCMKVRIG